MATDVADEDFVTIVPVGEGRPLVSDSTFVTVLTVGAASGAAEVIVRRPKGERLGLGLKFEGGSAAAEKVRRLLVQSCAENSPAANASTPWGKLIPGDEILAIDGISVSDLTRIDCVRRLKDSDESLTLLVRHFEADGKLEQNNKMEAADNILINSKPAIDIARPTALPPPVPPRKLGKKNSFKDKQILQTVGEQSTINNDGQKQTDKDIIGNGQHNGYSTMNKLSRKSSFDSHIHRQSKENIAYLKKASPEEARRLVRRLSDGKAMPPEAEVYIDLLSTEWERCLVLADAESDDTGSSISTVVDRLGSMTSSVENSIPSTPTMQPKTIDIQKVLNCIENIDSNILKDITSNRFLERQMDINKDSTVNEKTSFINGYNLHEKTTQISEEIITTSNKLQQNDNNNNTAFSNISNLEHNKTSVQTSKLTSDVNTESVLEKPKPMPRNTKIERSASEKKPRPITVPESPPPPVPESLLTPTKKNCIESWLQRSEAEMSSNNVDKLEDTVIPEVLPRLIDFVPKPQFKECNNEATLVRPTAPPPPPPVETREDGSGASLDTIGELDESSDVTDNVKPIVSENETKDRKSSYERNFWEDRIIKSDTEDKSLSNDETPLPSCPRQPPDGVETPSDVVEKMPEPQTRVQSRITVGWPSTTRTRFSYSSRTQDARSEASVKDKIAMFSNDHSTSSDRLDKCGTLPTRNSTTRKSNAYINNYSDVSSLDRRLTRSQDNLDEVPRSFKLCTERREVLGAMEITPTQNSTITKITRPLHTDNKPLFYGSTTTLPANSDSTFTPPIYHARSISDDNSNKNVHKSNLEYLIEQRKKSMSKLRGLVISEAQAPIVDLPAIKVQEPVTKSFNAKLNQSNINNRENKINNIKPIDLNDTKWKTTLLSNNIPKYSPAFKRKSLQVYSPGSLSKESTPERKLYTKTDNKNNNLLSTSKHTKTSLELNTDVTRTTSTLTSESILKCQVPKKEYKDIFNPVRDYKNVDIKISTAADIVDSDNDSAMSSTQSSYRSSASSPMNNLEAVESDSSRLSPRISSHYTHYSHAKAEIPIKSPIIEKNCEEYIKRNVCRSVSSDTNVSLSSSAGSAATSGSQASCSSLESSVTDSEKRKVSKSYNIDTINRRNILASAKCRSGRDDKLKSPVIEAKFSHESVDSPPSPVYKATDRLSTLTSSVSAVSNKGENRRRNKKIAETDSDSDSDVNIRQRKTDYKNTRLKRNASYSNKIKQTENTLEVTKIDDVPKNISEKIIKEIKKVGLDNIKTKEHIQTVNNSLSSKINECIIKKEDDNIKHPKINNLLHSEKSTNSIDKQEICVDTTKAKLNDISSEDVKIPICTVSLKRGAASGVGLILAGGIDCEAKDVTIHRVLADSVADKAGLKRGSKVRSINGYVMAGLTHAQSVTILKEQRSEVVIEIEDESRKNNANEARYGSENAESKVRQEANKTETVDNKASNVVTVLLEKAGGGAGLGFGLDGGRDSPHGDRPLTIKKLFAGGAAAQSGRVLVGAELLSAGGQSMEGFTRTQAWAALKALPSGTVALVLKNPKTT